MPLPPPPDSFPRRRRPAALGWAGPPAALGAPLVVWAFTLAATALFQWRADWPTELLPLVAGATAPALLIAACPARTQRLAAVGGALAVTALALADLVYLRVFDRLVPPEAMLLARQAWEVRGSAFSAARPADAVVSAALLCLLPLGWMRRPAPALPRLLRLGLLTAAGVVALSASREDPRPGGLVLAHVADVRRLVAERTQGRPTAAELAEARLFLTERATAETSIDGGFGIARGANVLLIQVEALNAWTLSASVDGQPVTPGLRAFAEKALTFPLLFDQTAEGRTADAEHLVLASQHPPAHGALAWRGGEPEPALPAWLALRGYTTLSAIASRRDFWNRAVRHRAYGFAQSHFREDLGPGEEIGIGLADGVFLERIAPRLRALPRPWLAWLGTQTMHGPQVPVPLAHARLRPGRPLPSALGSYLDRTRYVDEALRTFLGGLERDGTLANTVVVVYGDHGETFGFDPAELRTQDGLGTVDREAAPLLLDRVPALVRVPGLDGEAVRTPGGLVDLAPTLLHLLGLPRPAGVVGRSLIPARAGFAARARGGAVSHDSLWTGRRCFGWRGTPAGEPPAVTAQPDAACANLREDAERELRVSWLLSRLHFAGEGFDPAVLAGRGGVGPIPR